MNRGPSVPWFADRRGFALCSALAAGVGTFVYELGKELLCPRISRWGSHAMTICFVTLAAALIAEVNYRTARRVRTALETLRGRGERTEAALQALVDAVPAPTFLVDRGHNLLTLNQQLATRFRRSIEALRGRNAFELIPDQDLARARVQHIDEVFRTGVAQVFHDVNGGRHYANHLCPVRNSQGEIWAIGVVAADMTDLRTAEAELGRQEELLRFGLDSARLGVWEWDLGTDTVIVSPQAIELFGGRPKEWRGPFSAFLEYVEAPDRARVEEYLRSAGAGRVQTEAVTFRARPMPKRAMRWLEVQGRLFKAPRGRVRMVGTVGDATTKIEEAARRARADQALEIVTEGTAGHTGLAFFKSLVEVLASSLGTRHVLVARATDDGTGATLEPLAGWAGGPARDCIVPIDGRLDESAALRWRAAVSGHPPEGGDRPHVVAVPIVSIEGRTLGLVAALDDEPLFDLDTARWVLALSAVRAGAEIQRLDKEDEIMRLNADLERRVTERTTELTSSNRELEAFSYSVSHDLRSPLRSIDGFALALLEDHGDRLEPEARQYIDIVRQETQRMGQIIDDLLGLARLTRSPLRTGPVDVSAMCVEIVDDLRRREPHRGVEVMIAPRMFVVADANLLRIALENLVGNAWKFTGRTREPRIDIGLAGSPAMPQFHVADNGAGFDSAHASKLFQPFARLHTAAEYEGTGIGLATVARIIKRHGGSVWAESRPGAGATLRWTLPQPQPPTATTTTTTTTTTATDAARSMTPARGDPVDIRSPLL
jgi:PAS domain S-box-containing protein